jgi:hypothetical protein
LGDDNTCEEIEAKKPMAKCEEQKRDRAERAKMDAAPVKPQVSGQLFVINKVAVRLQGLSD